MQGRERHKAILEYLSHNEAMFVEDAVSQLGASPATIRRDFSELARKGLVERSRGGIYRLAGAPWSESPFRARQLLHSREKRAIARQAAKEITPHSVIMIDGGTSTFDLAEFLANVPVQIITNSVSLAVALDERRQGSRGLEVLLTGGHFYPGSSLVMGPLTAANVSRYNANLAFLSIEGISEEGVFNTNEFFCETERTMIAHAEKSIVLADHSKIGRRSMCEICPLTDIDLLITDATLEESEALRRISEQGVRIISVEIEKQSDNRRIQE